MMLDLGADDPEVSDLLAKALFIVQKQIEPLMQQDSLTAAIAETSELYRLREVTGKSPLNINTALRMALESATNALQQIAYFIEYPGKIDRITLQSLMRVAILGTARTVFVLLPTDPDQRLTNAKIVLAQDCQSGIRGMQQYVEFEGMQAMAPPMELLEGLKKQKGELYPNGRLPGETIIINRQTEALIEAFHAAGIDQDFSAEILRDHARWLWNTYSGLAHANSWPLLLYRISSDSKIPGDFPLDFYMTSNAFVIALLSYFNRSEANSAFTTEHVDLSTELP